MALINTIKCFITIDDYNSNHRLIPSNKNITDALEVVLGVLFKVSKNNG